MSALLAAARPLGMVDTPGPSRAAYDLTLLLGGTATGNRLRTRLLATALRGGLEAGAIVAVAADRPLSPSELAETHGVEPPAVTEWDDMGRVLDEELGPTTPASADAGRNAATGSPWRDVELTAGDGRPLRLLLPPSSRPNRRADTSDSVRFACERITAGRRRHVLLVTSAIYAPYQFFVTAPLLLARGTQTVELVGTPTTPSPDPECQAQRIAQEINSAIGAAVALLLGETADAAG